jgi:hypothetical protein
MKTAQVTYAPRVINLGKVTRSQVRKLRNGYGKLMEEIHQIAENEIAKLPDPGEGKSYKPVVIVQRRKPEPLFGSSSSGRKLRRRLLRKLGL